MVETQRDLLLETVQKLRNSSHQSSSAGCQADNSDDMDAIPPELCIPFDSLEQNCTSTLQEHNSQSNYPNANANLNLQSSHQHPSTSTNTAGHPDSLLSQYDFANSRLFTDWLHSSLSTRQDFTNHSTNDQISCNYDLGLYAEPDLNLFAFGNVDTPSQPTAIPPGF